MTENKNKYRQLTIQKALEIASTINPKTRVDLKEAIGEDMLNKLCRLGFISEGAIFDSAGERKAVWRFNRVNPFTEFKKPYTEDEIRVAKALYGLGY